MKKLFVTLITIISLSVPTLSHGADKYVTLFQDAAGTTAQTQSVLAGEVAYILRHHHVGSLGVLRITKGSYTFENIQNVVPSNTNNQTAYPAMQPFVVVGPCTITYAPHANGSTRFLLTIKISPTPNIMGVKQ